MILTALRVAGVLVLIGWAMSFAWALGMLAGYLHLERQDRRESAERAAEHARIAAEFAQWEREHIEWRRQRSEEIHPSHDGPDRQGNA